MEGGANAPKPSAPARPVIQLPSLREVQSAQRPVLGPNLFQASRSAAAGSSAQQPTPAGAATVRPAGAPPSTVPPTSSLPPAPRPPQPFGNQPAGSSGRSAWASAQSRPQQSSNQQWQQPGSIAQPGLMSAGPGMSHQGMGSSLTPTAAARPPGPVQVHQANPNAILVSSRQKGNPILKHIVNVRKEFADIVPDFIIGANACALFLSLRYHLLKPEYIHFRIRELQRSFTLRVLLCHVDVDDVVEPLGQVTRAAIGNNMTLICAWSDLECARYLETYKAYENKPADLIQGRADEDYLSRLNSALTTVRGVNRTDVLTLGATFQTAAGIMHASMEDLSLCPGIGPTKVRRLYEAFHEPFRKAAQPRQQPTSTSTAHAQPPATSQPSNGAVAGSSAPDLAPDLTVLDSEDEGDDFG